MGGVGPALIVALSSAPAIIENPGDVTFSALGKNAAIAIKSVRSGYYIVHPWLDTIRRYPRAADIGLLPTYVVVDEDHRVLSCSRPQRPTAKLPSSMSKAADVSREE